MGVDKKTGWIDRKAISTRERNACRNNDTWCEKREERHWFIVAVTRWRKRCSRNVLRRHRLWECGAHLVIPKQT
jgi:hypothetical protein